MIFKLLRPIAFLILAIALAVVYIKPTLIEIQAIQDETNDYVDAIEKASEFNKLITALVDRKNSFTKNELERLEAFAPDSIDEVVVMSDLEGIVTNNNMILQSIEATEWLDFDEATASLGSEETVDLLVSEEKKQFLDPSDPDSTEIITKSKPTYFAKDFTITLLGTYEQFKNFSTDVEDSLLLMEPIDISFESSEGLINSYTFVLRVYKLQQE